MLVRPFELRDLALLNRSALAAPWEISPENAAIQAEEAANGEVRWLVAEIDGKGVGIIEVIDLNTDTLIIGYLYAEVPSRMLAIVHWLIEGAILLAMGRSVIGWVHEENPNFERLVRMYQRMGFRQTVSPLPQYPFCMQLDYEVRNELHR